MTHHSDSISRYFPRQSGNKMLNHNVYDKHIDDDDDDDDNDRPDGRSDADEDDAFYVIGDRVLVDGYRAGSVAYFGETGFGSGDWVGVVLDQATGNHNGKLLGREYFQCAPNHGIFVRTHRIGRVPDSAFGSARGSSALSRTPTPLPTLNQALNLRGGARSRTPPPSRTPSAATSGLSSRSLASPAASSIMDSYYYDEDYRRDRVPNVASLARRLELLGGSSAENGLLGSTRGRRGAPAKTARPLSNDRNPSPQAHPVSILKRPRERQSRYGSHALAPPARAQSVESPSFGNRFNRGSQWSLTGRGSSPVPRGKNSPGDFAQSNRHPSRASSMSPASFNNRQPAKNHFQFRPRREPISSFERDYFATADNDDDYYNHRAVGLALNSEPPKRGDRVFVRMDSRYNRGDSEELTATLRFMGETNFAFGEWAGVELDDPVGKNDGSILGHRYFYCPQNYGLFVPASRVRKKLPPISYKLKATNDRQQTSQRSRYKPETIGTRPPVFNSMRSTLFSPPPPRPQSADQGQRKFKDSRSATPNYSFDSSSSPTTTSTASSSSMAQLDQQHSKPVWRTNSPLESLKLTTNPHKQPIQTLATDSFVPKFDDWDVDRELKKSLDKSTSTHSRPATPSPAKPKAVTYTFITNKFDGNPIACKTLIYD